MIYRLSDVIQGSLGRPAFKGKQGVCMWVGPSYHKVPIISRVAY